MRLKTTALLAAILLVAALPVSGQVVYYAKTVDASINDTEDTEVIREYMTFEFADSLISPMTGAKIAIEPIDAGDLLSRMGDDDFLALSVERYIYATKDSTYAKAGVTYVETKEDTLKKVEYLGYKRVPEAGKTNQLVSQAIDQKKTPPKDLAEAKTRYTTYKTEIDSLFELNSVKIYKPFDPK